MIKAKSKKTQFLKFGIFVVIFFAIVFFLLRGPYLSNSIKRIIIPQLENLTRERILIDKAVINLFPFYVQAKGFRLFDKDGNRILWITKTRVYIELIGLFSNEIRIRKLTLREPDLTAADSDIRRILDNIRKSASVGEKGKFSVALKNIQLTDGNIKYSYAGGRNRIVGSELFLNMAKIDKSALIDVRMKKGRVKLREFAELKGGFDGQIEIAGNTVKLSEVNLRSAESFCKTEGIIDVSSEGVVRGGTLIIDTRISDSTFNKFFGISNEKDGYLSFKGTVNLKENKNSNWPQFAFNLNTDSQFYLESLMDILKVDENIKGRLSLKGKIAGSYPDLYGKGTAKLEKAVLGDLPVDDLSGVITYEDKVFALKGFNAITYEGSMEGDAQILVPQGDYKVAAAVSEIDSVKFFEFVGWKPPFQSGNINGNFELEHEHDKNIAITADVNYVNTSKSGHDIFSRLDHIYTNVELENDVLTLSNALFSTSRTELVLNGNIDLESDTLNLDIKLRSNDITDLTEPHYAGLTAPVEFSGIAEGPVKDPEINGQVVFGAGDVQGIVFTEANADLKYKIKSLSVKKLLVQHEGSKVDAAGSIKFRGSKELFSFEDLFFSAKVSFTKVPVEKLINTLFGKIPVSGYTDGLIHFEGDLNNFAGGTDLDMRNSNFYGQNFDKILVRATFNQDNVSFKKINAVKNESLLSGQGTFSYNRRYDMNVSSNNLFLHDIAVLRDYPVDALLRLRMTGSGTIDRPDITFSMNFLESEIKGVQAGKGVIHGRLKDQKIVADGNLADGQISAKFNAVMPLFDSWSLDMNFHEGIYDFLLAGFFTDIPSDLTVSGEGFLNVQSQLNKLKIHSEFNALDIGMYDYTFKNKGKIVFNFAEDQLVIESFNLTGSDAKVSASGKIKLNDSFDLSLKGNINVEPLKALTDDILHLEGKSDFSVDIMGKWDNPGMIGEVRFQDVAATHVSFPQKIGPISGTFFLNKDRITFDSIKTGFAGGIISLSGMGHLKKFSVDRLFIASALEDIRFRPVEGLTSDIDGRLFYEFTPRESSLTGNIEIKRASYEKRFDWKRWLLGLKETNAGSPQYPEFLRRASLNVQVRGSDNIWINNNIAKAPVQLTLNLTGNISRPGLVGRLESNEGSVYFRGNEFRILEGSSVDFVDSSRIQPLFHIMADTYRNDYYVRLSLDGTIDNFTLSLFSDPPLPESDVLTLLTFGHVSKGETKGLESGIAASEATSILTGGLQENIQEELQDITGIERFDVEPHMTSTGAFTSKVTVGKRLLEDQISVIYSTAIGTNEEQIIEIQYKLNEKVSLVGSRNELGSTGADIKYRFEFK